MTEQYDGFIELGTSLDDVKEPKPLPGGNYNLTIESASAKKDENGGLKAIQVLVRFDDHPEGAAIFENLSLPKPDDKASSANFKLLRIKKFMTMFKVPYSGGQLNTTDFAGCSASNVPVELTSYDKVDTVTGQTTTLISNRIKL